MCKMSRPEVLTLLYGVPGFSMAEQMLWHMLPLPEGNDDHRDFDMGDM